MNHDTGTTHAPNVTELRALYRAAEARAARLRFIIEARNLLDTQAFETAAQEVLSRLADFAGAAFAELVFPSLQGDLPVQLMVGKSTSPGSDSILFTSQDGSGFHLTLIGPSRGRAIDADDRQTLEVVAGQLADAYNLDRQAAENQALLGDLERQRSELAALVAQLIQAQEQERQRVALDLHDGSAQLAAGLSYRLQDLAARIGEAHVLKPEIDQLAALARHSVADLRAAIADLRPPELDDLGVAAALRTRLDAIDDLEVIADLDAAADRWPTSTGIIFYRVAQEAITNVIKHAEASRLVVRLFEDGKGEAHLEVIDDGKGIGEVRHPQMRGGQLGIVGMRERLALLGGRIEIEAGSSGGTHVRAAAPLQQETTSE
ncbi:sensor histidine kinase [Rhizobium leguminosarum]|jgi:signal transduction histidine kinase|uniref:sensor histidine kinase n=1 Tax=Rhizobium TaxID=379 RepID=UPI000FF2B5C4|nr:sensor histidine kinase [Rhizobium leguminosarum]MBY2924513.1 sensor histidine kinase [Rhizobium leguminosarum]MBY2987629.1 sensor histidine kinase [Rhizobium leguminosarum]MBY2991785.1 sensor histidine kinase [Rhizobium leguminosarum]MBY2999522.1 sensor histidine kinase [Rhizobium leguminosarum]MBY3023718.1 sensor histidine kinase [Rhizobium leguminosarum]